MRGAILLIEDIDEHPYQIDRDLTQLHLSGALDGVVGIIGGRFPHESQRTGHVTRLHEILFGWADTLEVPCMVGLPWGTIQMYSASYLAMTCT